MTANSIILWGYIILLVLAGAHAFHHARSVVSLVMSLIFAVLLTFCAIGWFARYYLTEIFLGALIVVFLIRLAKTKKVYPAGIMLAVSVGALAALHLLHK